MNRQAIAIILATLLCIAAILWFRPRIESEPGHGSRLEMKESAR